MAINAISVFFTVVGGLALFLFSMTFLSDSLKRVAGEKLKEWLGKLTKSRLRACAVGTGVVAIIQSSGMLMVTLIGFLNAGLIGLEQAIWVMLGAEIGTTFTAQLVAFKLDAMFFFPVMALGFFFSFFAKKEIHKDIGNIIFSFGLLFLAMNLMASGAGTLKDDPGIASLLASFGENPLLGVIAGFVFTGIIQSSSASTGLIIAMGSAGVLGLPAAIALTLGANIGSTVTGMLASIGSKVSAKRLSAAQASVNIIGVVLFFPFILQFASFIATTAPGDLPRQIANSHTIFNLIVTAFMLPLSGSLVWLSTKIVKGEDPKVEHGLKYVNKSIMAMPSVAVAQLQKEIERMAEIALGMLSLSRDALVEGQLKKAASISGNEETLDEIRASLAAMLEELGSRELSAKHRREIAILKAHVIDIERVGDHANNLYELAQRVHSGNGGLSGKDKKQVNEYFLLAVEGFGDCVKAIKTRDKKYFEMVFEAEKKLDNLQLSLQEKLETKKGAKAGAEAGICQACLLEAAINLERVSDHAKNIVQTIEQGF
ncbi:MAG: Na/Pi cotransporter family protein [Candidatus Diapherotrites archaeon]|nr:Na/Pi cotransporter family protein [Candidatus Diapherotrites archaeon]